MFDSFRPVFFSAALRTFLKPKIICRVYCLYITGRRSFICRHRGPTKTNGVYFWRIVSVIDSLGSFCLEFSGDIQIRETIWTENLCGAVIKKFLLMTLNNQMNLQGSITYLVIYWTRDYVLHQLRLFTNPFLSNVWTEKKNSW